MKPLKLNSFYKFICFLLLVILIVSAVGFAADGWQVPPNTPDSGDVGDKTDDTDENKDGQTPSDDDKNTEDENVKKLEFEGSFSYKIFDNVAYINVDCQNYQMGN